MEHDIRKFKDCIRSDSEKWDIEKKKKKITFLLISANKDSLCSGIHFYETAIIFSEFSDVLPKSRKF